MHVTMKARAMMALRQVRLAALAGIVLTGATGLSRADSAYVDQAPTGAAMTLAAQPRTAGAQDASALRPWRSAAPAPTPQTVSLGTANLAQTLQIGSFNHVFQLQRGGGNQSTVGILGGAYNNAAVLQAGNNLRSNLVLLNTAGLNVGVLQPSGSGPVNALIARLPNGALLIKR